MLVVPDEHSDDPPRRVVIGWNGSRETVRAVHDALPLLLSAESIDVVADAASDDDSGQALARHLANHGCSSQPTVTLSRRDKGSPTSLSEIILSKGCDLLVIGGSTRSSWREALFGGVTRSVLLRSRIPVLAAI